MENDSLIEKAISKIIFINGTVPEEQMEQSFAACLSEIFGIEKTLIKSEIKSDGSTLYGYVVNTRKPYVDNQLSEYSSFPELTNYWSRGEKSCAVIPILVGGRTVSIVELLSKIENKFSDDLINEISVAAYMIGLSVLYRKEESKNLKLANYFNSAFTTPIPQILITNDGSVVRANSAALLKFGNRINNQQNISSLFDADLKTIKETSKTGRDTLTKSKLDSRLYAIYTNEAGPNLNYIYIRDATDEERASTIVNLMNANYGAGILLLTKDLRISYSTASIKKVIGFDSALTISKNLVDLVSEREKGHFKETLAQLDKSQRVSGIVGMITDKSTISQIRFTISNSYDGYMMLFYDASAERYVESMGRAFNEFLDGSSDLVIKADELGYLKSMNPAALMVLGYERTEIESKELRSIYADTAGLERDLSFVRTGGKVDNLYTKLRSKNGSEIEATNSIRLFKAESGPEYVIMARELETRRRLKLQEETIAKQQGQIQKLEKTGAMKSQFIYNISHELKTPLTSIMGFSKLLSSGEFGAMNDDQREHLSTIVNEADRLMGIISQILDAAKLESDKVKLELSEIDIRSLEDSPSIKALKESAQNKGLEFTWKVDYDVPNIIADHGRIIQIFVNLIGNALKFTEKGSINVKVSRKKRKIECNVIDTGIGISEENRSRLFKKFYEAPKKAPVRPEGSGTGLGLSITKEIVKLHGGEIGYEPRQNGGSRFWFTLPIKGKRERKKLRINN